MRIAIVGNRKGWDRDYIFKKLDENNITPMDILISGGAEGVDTFAQEYAKKKGCQIRILYPNPDIPSPKRYFDRNEQIADMCDKMIAFNKDGESSGTLNSINHAHKFNKEVILYEE